jgi:hypothetical protein
VRRHLLPPLIKSFGHTRLARRAIYRLFSQTWISYRTTRWPARGPRAGDRAPNAHLAGGQALFELLHGPDHHLLVFTDNDTDNVRALLHDFCLPCHVHPLGSQHRELYRRYRIRTSTVALIRPDGHIAHIGPANDLGELRTHLERWYEPDRGAAIG